MSTPEQSWQRLARAARRAPAREVPSAPFGFANCVAARWLAEPNDNGLELWAFFAGRVLVGAAIVVAGVVALNYTELAGTWTVLSDSAPLLETMLDL